MVALIFSRLPFRVKKIGNRRTAGQNRLSQNLLQYPSQHLRLLFAQLRSPPHRMNPGAPQAFVRINVADAAQNTLIEQERFDLRIA
jgi:hypothetical protein